MKFDEREFYELMQAYRHVPVEKFVEVQEAFDNVRKYVQSINESEYQRSQKNYEALIIKLTLLIGACRMPPVKKKDIEKSLEDCIKLIKKMEAGE